MCSMVVCQSGNALKKSATNCLNPSSSLLLLTNGIPFIEPLPMNFSMDDKLCLLKISSINAFISDLFWSY